MSQKERDRLVFVRAVKEGRMKQAEMAQVLSLSVRQVRRIMKRYEREGDLGLVHRLRGRRSNNRIDPEVREKAMTAVRENYSDFGPTLSSEKLGEREGLEVSRETVRRWMIEEGMWTSRGRKVRHRQWRSRRACFGELVQMDTSIHNWFEGRGEEAVLITMIDDATSRVFMRFFEADTTKNNMSLLKMYLGRFGRPLSIYADRASHFKTTRQPSLEEDLRGLPAQTQIERAFKELEIEYIPANSPQAKGRVERCFGTCQDRLVKELRLHNLATISQANDFLEKNFIPLWNRRFICPPASQVNAHRPIKSFDLAAILSLQTTRTVANDYTLRHKGQRYQIQRRSIQAGLRGAKVLVEERLDGSLRIRFRGQYLKTHKINPQPVVGRSDRASAETPVGLRPPSVSAPQPPGKPGPDHHKKADISIVQKTGHF